MFSRKALPPHQRFQRRHPLLWSKLASKFGPGGVWYLTSYNLRCTVSLTLSSRAVTTSARSALDQALGKKTRVGGMTKSVSTSGLSSLASGGAGGGGGGGVSSGLATEGRRQGMVGAHSSSSFGKADKTRDAVRDKLRPLLNNVRVRFSRHDDDDDQTETLVLFSGSTVPVRDMTTAVVNGMLVLVFEHLTAKALFDDACFVVRVWLCRMQQCLILAAAEMRWSLFCCWRSAEDFLASHVAKRGFRKNQPLSCIPFKFYCDTVSLLLIGQF